MKKLYMRMFAVSLLLIIALVGVKDSESDEKAKPDSDIGVRAANERLVASDVTSTKPFWCGPGHMLAYSKNDGGLLLQNVDTGEVITVSDDPYNRMVGCTNDGKWFVYLDVNATHKGDEENPKYGNEMVRYEVATGRRQVFAIAYGTDAAFTPLDDSIYLAGPHPVSIEMPEPKWNIIWSGKEYSGDLRLDEPPVALTGWNILLVDVLEPERRSFELELPGIAQFTPVLVDAQNRFYLKVREDEDVSYARCSLSIEEESVECETIFKELDWNDSFDIFNYGKTMLLSIVRDNCLRGVNIGSVESYCITKPRFVMGGHVTISPDESMVVFEVTQYRADSSGAGDLYIADLLKSK